METIYLGIVLFLMMLAVFDLLVGVSNDAVNFMNSAVGAKVATFKTIIIVAAVGVFVGATTSNGMMDIARHGIFQPDHFSFYEIMCILLAMMVTDVVLLDVFNTLGLPTSTTVSMVFELLGGTFVLAILRMTKDSTLTMGDLMNSDKALQVIIAIFVSVAIAFVVGAVVQYFTRLFFSFNYKKNLGWKIGVFGGISATALFYFILVSGLKSASFMTAESKQWISDNTWLIVAALFVALTIITQILYWCKVNVFKIIVLLGTFSLALAFAGNDLVNFIGVPLAGYSSYMDWTANGAPDIHSYMMTSLLASANTPVYFLIGSGAIMVYALATSKKAKNVIKTSVDLARQEEGDEMFGSSALARAIVRNANNLNEFLKRVMPESTRNWINSRFQKDDIILENGAAFDLVRASINLVLAGLLIIIGTTMKLPLSTTYVTFIVAMGSSLSDRAWSRESAVYRITGMFSVIGGWFVTAIVAFIIAAIVTIIMYFAGFIAMLLFIILAVFLLVRSNIRYNKKLKEESELEDTFAKMLATKDNNERLALLRRHVQETQTEYIKFCGEAYDSMTEGFINEDLKSLRKTLNKTDDQLDMLSKLRRKELIGLRRLPSSVAIAKNTWFHLGINSCEDLLYCLKRIGEPCKEHVDNNFNPIPQEQINEFSPIKKQVDSYTAGITKAIESNDFSNADQLANDSETLRKTISDLCKAEMNRIQEADSKNLKVSMVYLNILQETEELIDVEWELLHASMNFQTGEVNNDKK